MEETRIRNCPSCGAAMECKLQNFSIGADGGGGLLTLLADQYEVDLYACPACGKVELYTAAFSPEPEPAPYWCEHCQEEREDLPGLRTGGAVDGGASSEFGAG